MQKPRLKDNRKDLPYEPYPLGQIPNQVVYNIGKWLVYNYSVGKTDIDGEDWGDIFAKSIGGDHQNRPIGLADVILGNAAWSVKSVKNSDPFSCRKARVISGRCSIDYSYEITDPRTDPDYSGKAIIGIWNERVKVAKSSYEPLRSVLLVRNPEKLEYVLYEHELHQYNVYDYKWSINKNQNLEGHDINTKKHVFTWQPHGAQLTIIYDISHAAKRFKLRKPGVFDFEETMKIIGFDESWIDVV